VVNLGVSFLHLNETEKIENPNADARPNIKPLIDPKEELPIAMITTPTDATNIAIQTFADIFSFIDLTEEKGKKEQSTTEQRELVIFNV